MTQLAATSSKAQLKSDAEYEKFRGRSMNPR